MELPRAFYTSRVNEALASLAIHVVSARNIAASLKPVLTPDINLVEEETPRPIIVSVEPDSIPVTNSEGQNFTITGKNLKADSFKKIRLFLEGNPNVSTDNSDLIPFSKVTNGPVLGYTASVNLDDLTTGSYEVVLMDESGASHLPGFTVEVVDAQSTNNGFVRTTPLAAPTAVAQAIRPTILTGPIGKPVASGESVTFTVEASGTAPISYQWLFNGLAIVGANNNTYSIAAVDDSHQGNYTVVVGNSAGFVVSEQAELIISESKSKGK